MGIWRPFRGAGRRFAVAHVVGDVLSAHEGQGRVAEWPRYHAAMGGATTDENGGEDGRRATRRRQRRDDAYLMVATTAMVQVWGSWGGGFSVLAKLRGGEGEESEVAAIAPKQQRAFMWKFSGLVTRVWQDVAGGKRKDGRCR